MVIWRAPVLKPELLNSLNGPLEVAKQIFIQQYLDDQAQRQISQVEDLVN
jgi:hypothetical protein